MEMGPVPALGLGVPPPFLAPQATAYLLLSVLRLRSVSLPLKKFPGLSILKVVTRTAGSSHLNRREVKRSAVKESLSGCLLLAYEEGCSVQHLAGLTGLTEHQVITRLCAAARHLNRSDSVMLDPERALGVQWEFVFWQG